MRTKLLVGALSLLCTLALGGAAAAAPRGPVRPEERGRCAVRELSSREVRALEAELAGVDGQKGGGAEAAITIPVFFHVITSSSGQGDVSALVPDQIAVLNAAYAGAGFAFQLEGLEVVAEDAWYFSAQGSAEEAAMKASLRQGGPDTLNVYTTLGDIYLGWATFPNFFHALPYYDGVVLYWATLPGAGLDVPFDPSLEPDGRLTYDQGDTGTHEVGHWLGLYHTFQAGCAQGGDHVKDTPAEAAPQFFCAERDSCTAAGFPGLDPITNFMDYVDDVCMWQFTAGQEERMRKSWRLFRG